MSETVKNALPPDTAAAKTAKPAASASPWTRQNPFPGKLVVNRRLSTPDSIKDTRHFEIDLTGWGLSFEPGDSVAIYPTNDPELVEQIIRALGAKGDEPVTAAKTTKPFREALLRDFSITQPTPKFLKAIAERASAAPMLKELLQPDRKNDLQNYLWGAEVIDFLLDHPSVKFTPEEFVGLLTKLQPRLYSVASSLRVFPDQVHLVVDVVRYETRGRVRKGVASTFLAERSSNTPVPVYPSSAKHFHMPEDQSVPFDHDRSRHGRRTIPRLLTRAASARRQRKELALLRCATRSVRLRLQGRLGTSFPRRTFDAARLRVVTRPNT